MERAMPLLMVLSLLCGCGTVPSDEIRPISREEGSGTRSAFVELLGLTDEEGADAVSPYAEVTGSNSVMLMSVALDKNAIGYVSLGAMHGNVKPLAVDGTEPTVGNVKSGSYSLARSFLLAHTGPLGVLTQDFVDYVLSRQGQSLISQEGYIAFPDEAEEYKGGGMSGRLTISGSSSVAPVMELLAEDYMLLNPLAGIEIQQSGSSAGLSAALEGVCELAMSSRELTKDELARGLERVEIARDGIAVIVHPENPLDGLTSTQLRDIFLGKALSWEIFYVEREAK